MPGTYRDRDDDYGSRSRGRSRYEDENDNRSRGRSMMQRGGGGRSMRSREDEDDGRGRGRGGWFGDSEGHSQAARRGWDGAFRFHFGPYLALGGVVALFWGVPIVRWYLTP